MNVIVSAKVPVEDLQLLRARAEAEDRSVSSLIRRGVRVVLSDPMVDVRIGQGESAPFEGGR